jgi:hypothetical protein
VTFSLSFCKKRKGPVHTSIFDARLLKKWENPSAELALYFA